MTRPKLMVCITGGSCSGKTTLVRSLARSFSATMSLLRLDEMFVAPNALADQKTVHWDSPDLYLWDKLQEALEQLRAGQSVWVRSTPHEDDTPRAHNQLINPRPLIVYDGFLGLHRPAIARLFDLSFYLHIPEAEIYRRRQLRADAYWNRDRYIREILLPAHRSFVLPQAKLATYTLDGTANKQQLSLWVANLIQQWM